MKKLSLLLVCIMCGTAARLHAQIAAAPEPKASKSQKIVSEKKPKKPANEKEDKSSAAKLFGSGAGGLQSNEPTTTEIYADEAFFDSTKNIGIFSGRVKVTDPRFNLQSDKLTVYISKGQSQSLEKAVAEGNVGLVRDRPASNGGTPTRAVGRADKATYTASTGDVELRGTPRVQEGENMHVATSPDTVMIINQNSQLTTHGPSRTEIRQQPNDEKKKEEKKNQANPAQTSPARTPPPAALPTP
jgi:lipopolysaccharide transport protein LptA